MGTYHLIAHSRVSSGPISGWIQMDMSSLVTKDPGLGVLPIGLTFQESLILSLTFLETSVKSPLDTQRMEKSGRWGSSINDEGPPSAFVLEVSLPKIGLLFGGFAGVALGLGI